MATRNRRNEWHQVNEKWTRSLGERGMRVRLFQKRRDGTFYRTVWIPGRGRDHASMMTKDRGEAERRGRLLLSELLRQEELTLPGRLTLGALWDRYKRECAAFLDNKPDSRRDDESRAKMLLAFFGERREVRTLTARDQATYSARRRTGGILLPNGEKTRAVWARSVEMDLLLLHAMLSWATTVRLLNASRLLDVNPLAGVRREREQNPVRPIASWERSRAPAAGCRKFYSKIIRGTRKDAQRHLTEKLRELDTGSFVGVVRRTLADFGKEWLSEVTAPRLSRKTQTDYQGLFERHISPALGHRQLSALHPTAIQKFYNELKSKGLSGRTVRYVHSVFHGMMDHAVRVRLLHQNPTSHVSLPKTETQEMRILNREEVKAFLAAARQDRYAALWELLLATGMRPGEAEALRWEDIRDDLVVVRRSLALYSDGTWEFKEPKTANGIRTVPLPPTTTKALDRHRVSQSRARLKAGPEWRTDLGLVFTNDTGGPIDHRKVMRRYFKSVLRAAGLPEIRPYALRHTCASLLLEAGVPIKVISERLGHASVAFTMETYAHVMSGMQQATTDAMERIVAAGS